MFELSPNGVACIAASESCRLAAYQDGGGVWTIGYGHTGPDVHRALTITKAQATELFRSDLKRFADAVNRTVAGAPTTQDQFDAMVSLAFNIGTGGYAGSTVARLHNAGKNQSNPYLTDNWLRQIIQGRVKPESAADAFLMWVKDNGVIVPGLANRRLRERELYLGRDWIKAMTYV